MDSGDRLVLRVGQHRAQQQEGAGLPVGVGAVHRDLHAGTVQTEELSPRPVVGLACVVANVQEPFSRVGVRQREGFTGSVALVGAHHLGEHARALQHLQHERAGERASDDVGGHPKRRGWQRHGRHARHGARVRVEGQTRRESGRNRAVDELLNSWMHGHRLVVGVDEDEGGLQVDAGGKEEVTGQRLHLEAADGGVVDGFVDDESEGAVRAGLQVPVKDAVGVRVVGGSGDGEHGVEGAIVVEASIPREGAWCSGDGGGGPDPQAVDVGARALERVEHGGGEIRRGEEGIAVEVEGAGGVRLTA